VNDAGSAAALGFSLKSMPPMQREESLVPASNEVAHPTQRQRFGFRLIIGYKFAKAATMFAVALWLTTAPGAAYRTLEFLARELTEGGAAFGRAGQWINAHLSSNIVVRGAMLAWLDSLSSAIEGFLLMSGKTWAQWIVIGGLACLIPFEILSIEHRPGVVKALVLVANALICLYLARGQLRKSRA
jgi:uncharacterized membrane protein (DUF2068 family)